MSLYGKTPEEIYSFFNTYYILSEEVKKKIKDEFIDGEVLYELNDEDFENLGFIEVQAKTIKHMIENEKKKKLNEKPTLDDLIKKLNSIGIDNPYTYLESDVEKNDLKIGQKKILKKYKDIINLNKINRNSSATEILNFFRFKLHISNESIEVLKYFTGEFIFSMLENEIDTLKLNKEDEKKILNFLKNEKEEKREIKIENGSSNIETKMKLEDMIIYEEQDKNITMKFLYEKLDNEKEKIFKLNDTNPISKNNSYKLILTEQIAVKIIKIEDDIYFDLLIEQTEKNRILIEPLKTKIKIEGLLFDIDIISSKQLEFIIEEKKLISPKIYCEKCKISFKCTINKLMVHKECQDTYIYEPDDLFLLKTKEEFKNFFPKLLKTEFDKPRDFEINFEVYFNKNKNINTSKKFVYYKDIKERKRMVNRIKDPFFFGKILVYYGFPGIGKSITALHVLKYEIDHKAIKTLYIHCKYLSSLNKEYKYSKIRNILLYEIPFLFYDDFSSYQECVNIIRKFEFSYSNTYFNLIDEILNYLFEKPYKYIIAFDQYNQAVDPEEKIKNIAKKILENQKISSKFGFFFLLSLNNKDVKQMKIEQLLNIEDNNQIEIYEIKKITFDGNFQKPKKIDLYNKFGKTIKIHNELLNIDKDEKLEEYETKKKKKLEKT